MSTILLWLLIIVLLILLWPIILATFIWLFRKNVLKNIEIEVDEFLAHPEKFNDKKTYLILDLAIWKTYKKGDKTSAYHLAERLMDLNKGESKNWNTGNAYHTCYTIFGLSQLEKNNIKLAKFYLYKSAQFSSHQLSTYGPKLILAEAMLNRGFKKEVIAFLKTWQNTCRSKQAQFSSWVEDIENNQSPKLMCDDCYQAAH